MVNKSPLADGTLLCPAKILPELIRHHDSGRITLLSSEDDMGWRIYFSNCQLHFATATEGQQLRLQYLLSQLLPKLDLAPYSAEIFQEDYKFLCQLWQSGHISAQQLRQILLRFTQEALVHILSLKQAALKVESSVGLDPILIASPLPPLIESVQSLVQQQTDLEGGIFSPFQRLQILNLERILQFGASGELNVFLANIPIVYWQRLSAAPLTLYEVGQLLKINVTTFMRYLHPLVKMDAIQMLPYRLEMAAPMDDRPLVACIDDSKTMRAILRSILEPAGYKVLEIMSASQAVSMLSEAQPSVILMDISMPEVDGYELCSTLKRSSMRNIPVVMLTGREGVIDRFRARLVGAADYITKPFDPDHLISLVQQLA